MHIDEEQNPCKRRKARRQAEAQLIKRNIKQNNYAEMVDKFEKYFDQHMRDLLNILKSTQRSENHIANLSQRLDYNEYYSKRHQTVF